MEIIKKHKIQKMQWVFILLLSLAYSGVSVVGPMVLDQDTYFDLSVIISFALYFVLCVAVNFLLFSAAPVLFSRFKDLPLWSKFDHVSQQKFFLISWLMIFLSWVPAYLVFYPGVLSYDMMSQVSDGLGTITNNHHPILHTWLIGAFMKFGNAVCSSYEFGIGLLSLLQMVLLSYSLARMVCLLRRKKVPTVLVLMTLILSAVWFMNACLSVTMIKDCLHAAFLVLFVCHFTDIATDATAYLQKRINLFLFPLISFFMCAFRNNGIYIYVFCFAGLLVFRISSVKGMKQFIPLIAAIILPILMHVIYTGPVFKAMNIEPGQVREALCIPIQQLQRTAIVEEDNLTEEQTELMDYYIDNLEWITFPVRNYDPFIADYAKSCFFSFRYEEDPAAFWKFYIQMGLQYPNDYIMGFLSNTLGFWYPGCYIYSYVVYDNYTPDSFVVPLERDSIWDFQPLKDYYKSVCTSEFWRSTPVIRLFFVPAFTVWFLLYAVAFSWGKVHFWSKRLLLLLPLIGQYGIMILSPMSSFRYAWPFYLMFPVAFVAIFGEVQREARNAVQDGK